MGWVTKDLDFDSRHSKRVSVLYNVETKSGTYAITNAMGTENSNPRG